MEADDEVDEACEDAFGDHAVFFDEFGEVVEAGCDGEGEEEDAQSEAEIALWESVSEEDDETWGEKAIQEEGESTC